MSWFEELPYKGESFYMETQNCVEECFISEIECSLETHWEWIYEVTAYKSEFKVKLSVHELQAKMEQPDMTKPEAIGVMIFASALAIGFFTLVRYGLL